MPRTPTTMASTPSSPFVWVLSKLQKQHLEDNREWPLQRNGQASFLPLLLSFISSSSFFKFLCSGNALSLTYSLFFFNNTYDFHWFNKAFKRRNTQPLPYQGFLFLPLNNISIFFKFFCNNLNGLYHILGFGFPFAFSVNILNPLLALSCFFLFFGFNLNGLYHIWCSLWLFSY